MGIDEGGGEHLARPVAFPHNNLAAFTQWGSKNTRYFSFEAISDTERVMQSNRYQ